MTPALARRLTVTLAVLSAGLAVPLLGLFGTGYLSDPARTFAAIIAPLSLVAAIVFSAEAVPHPVLPDWVGWLSSLTTALTYLLLAALFAADWADRMPEPLRHWLAAMPRMLIRVPPELVLLLPLIPIMRLFLAANPSPAP